MGKPGRIRQEVIQLKSLNSLKLGTSVGRVATGQEKNSSRSGKSQGILFCQGVPLV